MDDNQLQRVLTGARVVQAFVATAGALVAIVWLLRQDRDRERVDDLYKAWNAETSRANDLETENQLLSQRAERLQAQLDDVLTPEHERAETPNMFKPGTALHDAIERGTSQSP